MVHGNAMIPSHGDAMSRVYSYPVSYHDNAMYRLVEKQISMANFGI